MSKGKNNTTSFTLNTLRTYQLSLIAMAIVYPAVHLTMDEAIKTPDFALWLFPALFISLYLLLLKSEFVQKHVANFVFTAFLIQTLYVVGLLYTNEIPYSLALTYYIYIIITVNVVPNERSLIAYLLVNFLAFATVIFLIGNKPNLPVYTSIFWAAGIFFLFYAIISAKIKRQLKLLESEEKLKEQQQEMDDLLNSLTAMITYKDSNNRVIRLNKAMADFMGKPPEFFIGVSLYDIFPKGLAHSYHEEDLTIIRTGKPMNNIIEEVTTPLGERKWIRSDKKPYYDKDGNIKGVVIFSVDVTEQIKIERKLSQSEELFRRIFNEAPYGVFIMDLSNKILHANKSFCQQLGYTEDEINKMSLLEIAAKRDSDLVSNLYEVLSPEIISDTKEIRILKKDNGIMTTNLFATHIKDEDDIPMYRLGMVENISERREAEEKLKEFSTNLVESNKDLEQFAYIISHDLREPLRMMTSYTQLLKRRYSNNFDDAGNEFMEYIVDGAKRMNNLINDLLSYSRVGRDKRARQFVDIGGVIPVVENNLRMSIQESAAKIIIKDVMPKIYCNKAQITTLIQNLVNNAIKYHRTDVAPLIEIGMSRKNDFWEFYVKDNGIGIPVKHLETIFLIFQRLHARDEYSGTGIGLAICKRIVQSHDGEIWVRSVEGEGSTFFFTFPVLTEQDVEQVD